FSLINKKIILIYYVLVSIILVLNSAIVFSFITNESISIKRNFDTKREFFETQNIISKIRQDYNRISGKTEKIPLIIDSSDFAKPGWFLPAFLFSLQTENNQ